MVKVGGKFGQDGVTKYVLWHIEFDHREFVQEFSTFSQIGLEISVEVVSDEIQPDATSIVG